MSACSQMHHSLHQSTGPSKTLAALVSHLETGPRPELASELSTLEAIFGLGSLSCDFTLNNLNDGPSRPGLVQSISLTLDLGLAIGANAETAAQDDDIQLRMRIHIPDDYPPLTAPRFELVSRYIGPFRVDEQLIQSVHAVFQGRSTDECMLYDGVESVKERVEKFYTHKLREQNNLKSIKDTDPEQDKSDLLECPRDDGIEDEPKQDASVSKTDELFTVFTGPPIVDRKSVFVGHAVSLTDPKDVSKILTQLLCDRKIARASHNMVAWRCEINGCLHQDNDDDGETAAASRMQHLLQILNVKNVFVCVSRWFGGIHLGADRFKHINQATRDALLVGGFITPNSTSSPGPAKSQPKLNLSKKKR